MAIIITNFKFSIVKGCLWVLWTRITRVKWLRKNYLVNRRSKHYLVYDLYHILSSTVDKRGLFLACLRCSIFRNEPILFTYSYNCRILRPFVLSCTENLPVFFLLFTVEVGLVRDFCFPRIAYFLPSSACVTISDASRNHTCSAFCLYSVMTAILFAKVTVESAYGQKNEGWGEVVMRRLVLS